MSAYNKFIPAAAGSPVRQRLGRVVVVAGSMLAAGAANAAIDTSGVTTAITEGGTAVGVVGVAVMGVVVLIKVYSWVRRAMG